MIDLRPVAVATPVRFARLLGGAGEVLAALTPIGGGGCLTALATLF